MKKSVYYYNNAKFLIPINIIGIILGIIAIIGFTIAEIESKKPINIEGIGCYLMFILAILFLIYIIIKRIEDMKKYKEALEKGMRVDGEIVDIIEKDIGTDGPYYVQHLKIKYLDPKTNEETELTTGRLAINPYEELKSKKCNVYIYNDNVIAEDFELTKNKEEAVFSDIEREPISSKKAVTMLISIIVVIIVLYLFLVFKNVIIQ